jgi:hypothetical protein
LEEYRLGANPIKTEALPQIHHFGFALLTRRSPAEIPEEILTEICAAARNIFDLVLLDNPKVQIHKMESLVVVENTLTSLIGFNALTQIMNPKIVCINKYSAKLKKRSAISGFINDAKIFCAPKSQDLGIALSLGVLRKLSPQIELELTNILEEILHS